MFLPPPIPAFEGLHPLVVHFPIALLLVAPLLVLIGALMREKGMSFCLSGLLLMVLGSVSALVSVESGEAAGAIASGTGDYGPVLAQHAAQAEITLIAFSILSGLYGLFLLASWLLRKKVGWKPLLVSHGVFLLLYAVPVLILSSTAHLGGRLVHEFGIRSFMGG